MSQETIYLGIILYNSADIEESQNELEDARLLSEEAVTLFQRHPTWPWEARQRAYLTLAKILGNDLKDYSGLETILAKALTSEKKLLGDEHPLVIKLLEQEGISLEMQQKLEQAETVLREALAQERKRSIMGPSHEVPVLGSILEHLADVLRKRRAGVIARPVAEEAVAMYQRHVEWPAEERERAFQVLDAVLKDLGDSPAREVLYRDMANQGYPFAMTSLGIKYASGDGVDTNFAEAINWFRKAADKENAPAEFNLGVMYWTGSGVKKDPAEALKWYRKAAEQGYQIAELNLGEDYLNGFGVERDYKAAASWFRKAAEAGNATAQNELGGMYSKIAKNDNEAAKWFRKAADRGSPSAENHLAWILATSPDSMRRDGLSAVRLGEKAVAATNRQDTRMLGTLAAAYAEVGQFEKAVNTQKEAMALLKDENSKQDYASHLKLYESKTAYRENR